MNLEYIENAIENIKKQKDDPECALLKEDRLYLEFIEYVSSFDNDLGIKAKKMLEVKEIEFPRWYA